MFGTDGKGLRRNKRSRYSHLESLEDRRVLAPVISEFMAVNDSTLQDVDGDYSDWIEIHNPDATAVNLNGWYLTDSESELNQWAFPDVTIPANGYMVVFASGKDRSNPASQLHTNFKLSSDGEYLGLIRPDGQTVEFAYAPNYPAQTADVSYGLSLDLQSQGVLPFATPGSANSTNPANARNSVVINELMYSLPRAGLTDAENIDEEFIELHNRSSQAISLAGWRFTRGVDFTFPAVSIPANGYLVVAANVASFQAKYPGVNNVVGNWTGKLSNNGETVELVTEEGLVADTVSYASQGDWSVRTPGPNDRGSRGWIWGAPHDGGGMSLELINSAFHNN
ncbi:MAG: lamin tail domain-containing protein, partial [Planctomycetales bacterium]|nr:lamin tail domain-containing protein [Planctomycetales bacterium]